MGAGEEGKRRHQLGDGELQLDMFKQLAATY